MAVNPDSLKKKKEENNQRAKQIEQQIKALDNSRLRLIDELKGLVAKNEAYDELIKEFEAPVELEAIGPEEHPEGALPSEQPENEEGDEQT